MKKGESLFKNKFPNWEVDLKVKSQVDEFINNILQYCDDANNENYKLKKIKADINGYEFKNYTEIVTKDKRKRGLKGEIIDYIYEYKAILGNNELKKTYHSHYEDKLRKILLKYTKSDYEIEVEKFINHTSEIKRIKSLGVFIELVLIFDLLGLLLISVSFIMLLYYGKFIVDDGIGKFDINQTNINCVIKLAGIFVILSFLIYLIYYFIDQKNGSSKLKSIQEENKVYNSKKTQYTNEIVSLKSSKLSDLLAYQKVIKKKYFQSKIFKCVKRVDFINEFLFPLPGLVTFLEFKSDSNLKIYTIVIFILINILWFFIIRKWILDQDICETGKLKRLNDEINAMILSKNYSD
jgi:hypothetical protein